MKLEEFARGKVVSRQTWNVADLLSREPFATVPIPDGSPLPSDIDQPLLFLLSLIGSGILNEMRAIRQQIAPEPTSIVGTDYVAAQLNLNKQYVAQMAREGRIPKRCIVAGTGWGTPYGFNRKLVDEWIETRVPSPKVDPQP